MTNLMRWLRNSLARVPARRSPERGRRAPVQGDLPEERRDPDMQNLIYEGDQEKARRKHSKMLRWYSDKAMRAGRDYDDKEMCP